MQESTFTTTPGQLLLAAREARSLTQSDIAKHMRLSVQAVQDIENDAYTQLGVRTFVRGYLCAYARLVGIDTDKILASFDASGLMPDTKVVRSGMIEGAPVTNVTRQYSRFQPSRWIGFGVCALVFVVVVLFWQDKKDPADNKIALKSDSSTPAVVNKSDSDQSSTIALTEPMNVDDSAKVPSVAPTNLPADTKEPTVQKHHAKASHVNMANNGFTKSPGIAAHTTYTISSVPATDADETLKTS